MDDEWAEQELMSKARALAPPAPTCASRRPAVPPLATRPRALRAARRAAQMKGKKGRKLREELLAMDAAAKVTAPIPSRAAAGSAVAIGV
jgi:hypothetical protein